MVRIGVTAALAAALLSGAGDALAQDEASLRAADEVQRRLVFDSDVAGLAELSHPDLLINGPNGRVVTRDQFFESVRTGAIAKERFERIPESIRITGDLGVVMGREVIVAAEGSRDRALFGTETFQRRYTNIFLFQDGRWRFIARQAAVAPPAR